MSALDIPRIPTMRHITAFHTNPFIPHIHTFPRQQSAPHTISPLHAHRLRITKQSPTSHLKQLEKPITPQHKQTQHKSPISKVAFPTISSPTESSSQSEPFLHYLCPRLLLLGVAAIWGTNFPTVKLLQSGPSALSVATAALARFGIAALSLAPFALYEARTTAIIHKRSEWFPPDFLRRTFGVGIVLAAGYFTQSMSLLSTDANKTAFICSLAVVIVPLLERLPFLPGSRNISREGPLATWGAPLLAVIGVAMLELGESSQPTGGDFWALLQAVGFASGFLFNERIVSKYPDLNLSSSFLQLTVVATLSMTWATVDTTMLHHSLTLPDLTPVFATQPVTAAVLYAGVVTTALTVWLANEGLRRVSASELAVLLSTEPFWASAFSAVILGEHMGSQAVLGGCFILSACLANQVKGFDVDIHERLMRVPDVLAPMSAVLGALQLFLSEVGESRSV